VGGSTNTFYDTTNTTFDTFFGSVAWLAADHGAWWVGDTRGRIVAAFLWASEYDALWFRVADIPVLAALSILHGREGELGFGGKEPREGCNGSERTSGWELGTCVGRGN
jgi:hypothetical protein